MRSVVALHKTRLSKLFYTVGQKHDSEAEEY
jgi:hypothetical protein